MYDLPFASSVGTEPLTADDWEIIVSLPYWLVPLEYLSYLVQEIHASHVESTLLSQVRVAKVGQEIDVWVLGRTRVRLLVGRLCCLDTRVLLTNFPSLFGPFNQRQCSSPDNR